MKTSKKCPKCNGEMAEGHVADFGRGGPQVSRWIAGAPEKSFLFGLKIDGKEQYEIQTFRCAICGFLEEYATA